MQEGTYLKGDRRSGGGRVSEGVESNMKDQDGGGGGGGKWGTRWYMDADGSKWRLISIGTSPNSLLAYDPGTKHYFPTISMLGGHVVWLYIYIERERFIWGHALLHLYSPADASFGRSAY